MADIFSSLLGQQDMPTLTAGGPADAWAAITKYLPKIAGATVDYNKQLAPGIAEAQRMGEDVYDPNRGAIRDRAGSLILESLQNPFAIPPQILQMLRKQGFEGAAGSGLNTSEAARQGVATLLGDKALEYGNSIINRGAQYGTNTANLWQPESIGVNPATMGNLALGQIDQQNMFNKYNSDLDYQNSMNLLNRPLQLTGEVDKRIGEWAGMFSGAGLLGKGPTASSIQPYGSGGGGTFNVPGVPPGQSASWVMPRGY